MKKLLALLAVVLCVVSCQTEPEGLDVNVGGEIDAIVNVTIPEAETRAAANPNSALGAFENVDFNDYTIRYILQVYYKNGENYVKSDERLVKYSDGKSVAFDVRLVPQRNYQFVVWADVVASEADVDNHYVTSDLKNITLNGEWNAMDETRDAFTATVAVNNYSSASNITVNLKRPFAKLRVVTTDMVALNNLEIMPTKATVEYTDQHYNAFNAFEGKVINDSKNRNIKHENFTIASYRENVDEGADMTLFTDYFFAKSEEEPISFILTVYDQNGVAVENIIKTNNFSTDIPVQCNYLTTIKGNILTDGNNVTVEVKDAFENGSAWNPNEDKYDVEIVEVGNAADLQQVIEEADVPTTIVISGDINLGDLFGASTLSTRATAAPLPIVVAEGKSLVLDLNGHKITTPWEDEAAQKHYYAFDNSGSLTIKDSKGNGNGEIVARGIFNRGTLTLESGKINACDGNGGYGVRNYEGAKFIMNGGSIVTSYEDGDKPGVGYDACPVRVDEGATATFNGGTINNISNFTVAIDNYGETTINGGTFTTIHTTIANSATMTINGGSFTCNGLEGVTAHAFWAAAGTTTINGGTFNGKDNYNGFNVCASKGATVNIKGGKFLPVHSGSLYGEGTIIVKGGEFFDDPSARVAEGYKAVEENSVWTVSEDIAHVTTAAELKAAAEAGAYKIVFDADIEASEIIVFQNSKIIEGNGKTFTSTAARAINVSGAENVTIKNLTINASGERAINIIKNAKNITIDNVTATAANYTVNVATSAPGAVVAINNSTLNGLCTVNVASAGARVTVDGSTVNCNDNNTTAGESYAALCLIKEAVGGKIIATNSTINVTEGSDSTAGRNGAEDGEITIDGSVDRVVVTYAVITYTGSDYYYGFQTIAAAVEFAKDGDTISLIRNVELTEPLVIAEDDNVVLDLNGKTVTAPSSSAFEAKNGAELTIKNGKVVAYESTVRAIGGKATIESGEYTSTGTALDSPATYRYSLDCREGGELIINGGTFKSNNGMINVGSTVTINGGKFENIVEKTMTRHLAYVSALLTINDGEFYGKANSSAGGCFFCGAAASCDIQINGGKFTSLWYSGSVNRIFESYASGSKINVTGGMFNTNGGIATFVTENTDEATKAAYPYVAK